MFRIPHNFFHYFYSNFPPYFTLSPHYFVIFFAFLEVGVNSLFKYFRHFYCIPAAFSTFRTIVFVFWRDFFKPLLLEFSHHFSFELFHLFLFSRPFLEIFTPFLNLERLHQFFNDFFL